MSKRFLIVLLVVAVVVFAVVYDGRRRAQVSLGFSARVFISSVGYRQRYVLFQPYVLDDRKRPVIVFLNDKGQDGSDGVQQLSNNFGQQVWKIAIPTAFDDSFHNPSRLVCRLISSGAMKTVAAFQDVGEACCWGKAKNLCNSSVFRKP